MPSNDSWCLVSNVCGYTLKEGVVIVAVTSIILSAVVLFTSLVYLFSTASKELSYNTNSVNAINLISALVCCSTCLYEIIISSLLLFYIYYSFEEKYAFLLTLWLVSNINLLILFFGLLVGRSIIYWLIKNYIQAIFTMILGIIYEVVYIYFAIIINSYETAIDPDLLYHY